MALWSSLSPFYTKETHSTLMDSVAAEGKGKVAVSCTRPLTVKEFAAQLIVGRTVPAG